MDDLSINGQLSSTTPVKEVRSRHSSGGDQQESRNRRPYNPKTSDEENDLPEDDSPHAVDEQA